MTDAAHVRLPAAARETLDAFVAGLVARFGSRLVEVRLFGSYARGEAHLAYAVKPLDPTAAKISFTDDAGPHTAGHVYAPGPARATWDVPTGKDVRTHWVELAPAHPR